MVLKRRDLKRVHKFLVSQHKEYCVRDGCEGTWDVVAGTDDRIHLECPVCKFSSTDHTMPKEPFTVGDRVRCVGYPIVGAGTVVQAFPLIGKLQVKFDLLHPPRADFVEYIGDDGSIGLSAMYMERLFP